MTEADAQLIRGKEGTEYNLKVFGIYINILCSERENVARKLRKLSEETGYPIIQKHGQRIYGGPPPNWTGPVPERGTELYCSRIPGDCFEVIFLLQLQICNSPTLA